MTALALAPAAGAAAAGGDDGWSGDGPGDTLEGTTDGTLDPLADETNDTTSTDGSLLDDRDDGGDGDDSTTNGSTDDAELESGVSLRAGDDAVLNASLDAGANEDGVALSVDATSDTGFALSSNATLAGNDDASGSGGATGDDGNESSAEGPAATDGDTDGDDGGSSRLPDAEDAGAGLAIGSVLVGGGLLARRVAETSVATGGAGGGSMLSVATAWIRTWGWRILALFGYQRFDGSDPLEHETRAGICERIEDAPGVFLTELSDETDVPMSTLRYHLRILAYEDLITSEKVRGKRRYFPAEVDPDALDPALDDEATAAVLEAVARDPDSVSGIADRIDRDPSTVTHHLQRLDEEGLVEREREGRSVVSRLADGIDRTDVAAARAGHAD